MKKVFTLLSMLMATICTMAQTTFSGTWQSKPGNFSSFESTVVVTIESNGTSTIEMKNMTLGNDDLGTIIIRNVYTEQNGSTYTFNMGSNTTFDITEGNMSGVTKGVFEGYGTMDNESLMLKANYLDYGTTSLRMVVFNGTKINTGGGGDSDKPTIVSTESFNNALNVINNSGQASKQNDVKAVLCKYSDDTYGLTISQVASLDGAYGSMTFNGLNATEEDGNTYIFGDVDVLLDENSSLYGKNLKAEVSVVINEDGELSARVDIIDTDDEAFMLVLEYGNEEEEPTWPTEPISVTGMLSSYTNTSEGEASDANTSVLTITPTEKGKCTLTLTDATLPGTTITLGTITIEGVNITADQDTYTIALTANNIEAKTNADHPYYQTLDITKLSGDVTISYTGEENTESANASISFTVNNNDTETVDYSFTTNGYTNGITSLFDSTSKVARIYNIAGMSINTKQRGINIVRQTNGKTIKVLVK